MTLDLTSLKVSCKLLGVTATEFPPIKDPLGVEATQPVGLIVLDRAHGASLEQTLETYAEHLQIRLRQTYVDERGDYFIAEINEVAFQSAVATHQHFEHVLIDSLIGIFAHKTPDLESAFSRAAQKNSAQLVIVIFGKLIKDLPKDLTKKQEVKLKLHLRAFYVDNAITLAPRIRCQDDDARTMMREMVRALKNAYINVSNSPVLTADVSVHIPSLQNDEMAMPTYEYAPFREFR